jgi:predicted RNA-binding protein (virulence factor B family)
MPIDELLGRAASLTVRRFGPPGAFLALDATDTHPHADVLLLPRSEVPEGLAEGDAIDVFVYLDSADRPIATTRRPKLVLGEVTFLQVTETTRFGAFADWGLPKELLVPFAEQTCEMRPGERYAIGLFIDASGRLAGTMRVSEMLRRPRGSAAGGTRASEDGPLEGAKRPEGARGVELDEWIQGEAWRRDPDIGVFVILERSFVGLVPASEPNALSRGEAARFRVANILADGKVELSLRGHAHQEVESDAQKILALVERPDAPRVGDRSSPEQIRELLGLSKKAFKRAAGRLLKERAVSIDADGFLAPSRR